MTAPLEQLHDILPGPQPKVLDEQSIILIAVSLLILFCLAALYKRWPRYKFYWRVKRELRVIIKKHPDNWRFSLYVLVNTLIPPDNHDFVSSRRCSFTLNQAK